MFSLNYRGMEFARFVGAVTGTTVRYEWYTADYDPTPMHSYDGWDLSGFNSGDGKTLFECFNEIDEVLDEQ